MSGTEKLRVLQKLWYREKDEKIEKTDEKREALQSREKEMERDCL